MISTNAAPLLSAIDFFRARDMRPYNARALELSGKLREGKAEEAARSRQEAGRLQEVLQQNDTVKSSARV